MATARFALLAMAALVLLGTYAGAVSFSSTPTCPNPTGITLISPEAGIEIAVIALMVSFAVIAIGYMVGKAFPTTGVQNWLHTEYWELAKSIMLIISIYAILTVVSNLGVVVTGSLQAGCVTTPATGPNAYIGNLGNLYSESEYYLTTAASNTKYAWNFVGTESAAIGMLQYMTVGLWLPIPIPIPFVGGFAFEFGFTMRPYQNYMIESGNVIIQHFESSIYDLTQFVLYPVTIMLIGLQGALPLLMSLGLGFLIPLGLIFRAFPFVRGIGGTLVAMGFGAAIVFPSILVFFNAPITNGMSQLIYGPSGSPPSLSPTWNGCPSGNSWLMCEMTNVLAAVLPSGYVNVIEMGWQAFGGTGANGGMFPFLNYELTYGFYLILQLILFVFDLLILYTITDNVAKLLGGTIRLSLGSKLKVA